MESQQQQTPPVSPAAPPPIALPVAPVAPSMGYYAPVAAKPPVTNYHQAAKAAWIAPLMAFALNSIFNGNKDLRVSIAFFGVFLYVLGLVCGVCALFGIPKYGNKGILVPAIIGIVLNLGVLAVIAVLLLHLLH